MKQIIVTIILITSILFSQGITNTLGGNNATDKFIIENSDAKVGMVVTGEGKIGIGTSEPQTTVEIYSDDPIVIRRTKTPENGVVIGSIGNKGEMGYVGIESNPGIILFEEGGNVGINTTSPEELLDVNGVIKMVNMKMPTGAGDGYILTSDANGNGSWQGPRTEYLSIPSCAFLPQSNNTNISRGQYLYGTISNSSFKCLCPVYLPEGSTVTELYIEGEDSDSNNDVYVSLNSFKQGKLAELETSGSYAGSEFYISTSIINNPVIDNVNRCYWLELEWTTGSDWENIFLSRVRIAYML